MNNKLIDILQYAYNELDKLNTKRDNSLKLEPSKGWSLSDYDTGKLEVILKIISIDKEYPDNEQ